MSYLSPLVTNVAISDIDVAENGLKALIDPEGEYYPTILLSINESLEPIEIEGLPRPDPIDWAHFICTYSRYIYLNVCKYRCSIERIKTIVQELVEANKHIAHLIKECEFNKEVKSELNHYMENINLRINNLRSSYEKQK